MNAAVLRPEDLAESIMHDCQDILAAYLEPNGKEAADTISDLLRILDGPPYREFKAALQLSRTAST